MGGDLKEARILVCEDQAIIAADLEYRLNQLGYTVCGTANNGPLALQLVESLKPDLVMMDILIKGEMDGIDTAEIIRDRWGVPVVFVTAYADADRLARAKLTYPFGYVLKPFEERELKVAAEMALFAAERDGERKKTEEYLRSTLEFFQKTLDGFSSNIAIINQTGLIVHVNESWREFAEVNGVGGSNLNEGANYLDICDRAEGEFADQARGFAAEVRGLFEGKSESFEMEYSCHSPEKKRWFMVRANLNFLIDRHFVIVEHIDITARKLAEKELKVTLEAVTEGLWSWNFITGVLEFSPGYYSMLGYEPGEFQASYDNWADLIHPDDRDEALKVALEYLESKSDNYENEFRLKTKSGDHIWVSSRAKVVERDENGRAVRMIGNHQDITRRKEAEENARKSEDKYRKLFNLSPDAITVTRLDDGKFVEINPEFTARMGYEKDEIIGKTPSEIKNWHDMKDRDYFISQIKSRGECHNLETVFRTKSDEPFPALISGKLLTYCSEDCVISITKDISERKQAEEALKRTEELYQTILESSPINVALVRDGRFLFINPAGSKMLGFGDPKEIIGLPFEKFIDPDGFDRIKLRIGKTLDKKTNDPIPQALIRSDGSNVTVESISAPISLPDGPATLVMGQDISRRVAAEKALRQSEARYREMTEQLPIPIAEYDLNFQVTYCNRVALTWFGYSRQDIEQGQNITDLIPQSELDRVSPRVEKLLQGQNPGPIELNLIRKDGREVYGQVTPAPIIRDGKVVGIRACFLDLTEQKRAREEIVAALKEKEVLLQEIHHRVKNNLTIIGSILKLKASETDSQEVNAALGESINRIHAISLIHDIAYNSELLAEIDIKSYLERLVEPLNPDHSRLRFRISTENRLFLPLKTAVPTGIILNELITNSLKYAFPQEASGEIIIEAEKVDQTGLKLVAADTGVGLPPGFDWRNADTLGLKIVRSLVEIQLQGTIDLDSAQGTRWTIIIPT